MNQFFAREGVHEPCGMFTADHIRILLVSAIFIGVLLYFFRAMTDLQYQRMVQGMAFTVTGLEAVKIAFNFINGYTWMDAWFPLSFCSLFIYSLWLTAYGKGTMRQVGEAFLVYGAPLGGVCFLLFPTTSLMHYPVGHYLCLYSMFFHSAMILVGTLSLCRTKMHPGRHSFTRYTLFVLFFASIAIIMNSVLGSNIMILREPYNLPIRAIQAVYSYSHSLYTLFAGIAYLLLPYAASTILARILRPSERACSGQTT